MTEQIEFLPNTERDETAIEQLLNEHSSDVGVEFINYSCHIEQNGELVAGISAWALGSDLHIENLAVAPAARKSGLGGKLLAHVEKLAREDGCTTASVDTFSHQAPDYYPAHGYEVIFRYPLDDGSERIYFSKRL